MKATSWDSAIHTFIAVFAFLMIAHSVKIAWGHKELLSMIWSRMRLRMFVESPFVIATVISTGFLIADYWEFSRYGWISLLISTKTSVIGATVIVGARSGHWWGMLLPLSLLSPLFIFLPVFAKMEEDVFRRGAETLGKIVLRSIAFGLVHLVMGIPLCFALSLSIGGLYFGYKYKSAFDECITYLSIESARSEAVMQSAAYHTAYNMIVFGFAIITLLLVMARMM